MMAQVESDTCRFLSYNALKFDYTGNGKEEHIRTILAAYDPDVFVIQELMDASGASRFLDSVVRVVDPNYAMAEFVEGYDTDNGLFYDATKYTCIANTPIITELRNINQFHMRHLEAGEEFYIYSVHLKASSGGENAAQRKREVDSLRKYTALLPEGAYYWVSGDFNMYGSYEEGYAALVDDASSGYFVDLLADSLTSTWNNAVNARFHTQSTRLDAFGGGATGGMDDRFDMILCAPDLIDGDSMYIIAPSLKPLGNDGLRYNQTINEPTNMAVSEALADALYFASDHIPITASFVFQFYVPEDTTQDTTILQIAADVPVIQLYPNPADAHVEISTGQVIDAWWIHDAAGREILHSGNPATETRLWIALPADLAPGIYVFSGYSGGRSFECRFIKK